MSLSTTNNSQRTSGGTRAIQVVFRGADCAAGVKLYATDIPFAFRIISATIQADQSGSAVVTIGADAYPAIADLTTDKINASAPPTLSSAQQSKDTTLTGWTTSFARNYNMTFELTSVTTCTEIRVTLEIEV